MRGVSEETILGPSPSSSHELQRRGLLREDRLGSGLDGEAVEILGADQASESRRGLEQRERDPAAAELVRGREPADPAADDDHVH